MPTIEGNKWYWGEEYEWPQHGNEWSEPWGTTSMQWHVSILSRVSMCLPASTILEIAPGFGRWTHFLKEVCDHLIAVDLAQKCVAHCRERFRDHPHISCYVNDGLSLPMISDASIDFAFSYDSLVHAERDVLDSYIRELARTLKPEGVAFIHHSNLGEYPLLNKVTGVEDHHNRAASVTAEVVAQCCERNGLHCVVQEKVNWCTRRTLIDCFSTIVRQGAGWSSKRQVIRNERFMEEAELARRLSRSYSWLQRSEEDAGSDRSDNRESGQMQC